MEVTGTVKKVFQEQQISPSFKKREVVVTTEEQYPQTVAIEFTQDKTDLLDNVNEGDRVSISINIRGREWTSPKGEVKYFVSLQGWKIQSQQAAADGAPQEAAPMESYKAGDFDSAEQEDDLPF